MLPNFLFIGAEKSGTTWFYRRLKEHPDIYLPETKEIHFFNRYSSNLARRHRYEKQGISWYEDFFRHHDGEKAVGEVTPMYLCDPRAPERIKALLPDAKLICCLRNPVDRAYSHYWMARRKGHTNASFEQVIACEEPRFLKRGLYHEQLRTYLNLFPKRQIMVLICEDVFRAPVRALQSVCRFLEVDPLFYNSVEDVRGKENRSAGYRSTGLLHAVNKTAAFMRSNDVTGRVLDVFKKLGVTDIVKQANRKSRAYPPMQPAHREQLRAYYAPSIAQSERLLERRITAWPHDTGTRK